MVLGYLLRRQRRPLHIYGSPNFHIQKLIVSELDFLHRNCRWDKFSQHRSIYFENIKELCRSVSPISIDSISPVGSKENCIIRGIYGFPKHPYVMHLVELFYFTLLIEFYLLLTSLFDRFMFPHHDSCQVYTTIGYSPPFQVYRTIGY